MKHVHTILLLSALHTSAASTAQWQNPGPFGAVIISHVQHNGSELIGTNAGILESTDGAQTWTPLGADLPAGIVQALHSNGGVLYAGVDQLGLFVSTDDGNTWTAANNAAMGGPYLTTGITTYSGGIIVCANTGIWSTVDQGASFTSLNSPVAPPGPVLVSGSALLVSDYFGFPGDLYRSIDGGASWTMVTSGLPATARIGRLHTIASADFAVSDNMYRSLDNGATWTQLNTTPNTYPAQYSCVAGNTIYTSTGGNLGVEVTKYDVGGTAWVDITTGLPDTWTWIFFPVGSDVLIDKNGALHRTSDGGANWSNTGNTGMVGLNLSSVQAQGTLVLAGGEAAVYRSSDNGTTWTRTLTDENAEFHDLHFSGSRAFACGTAGVYRSTDNGLTWPTQQLGTYSLICMDGNSTELFTGGGSSSSAVVQRSGNNGDTWSNFSAGLPSDAVVIDLLVLGSTVFAGVGASIGSDAGVYSSATGAASFTQHVTGIEDLAGIALASTGSTLYVGTENGVFSSTNMGTSWSAVGAALSGVNVNDLVVDGAALIAATEQGIFLLVSGASDWVNITDDLPTAEPIQLSVGSDQLFVALYGRSVALRSLATVGIAEGNITGHSSAVFPNPAAEMVNILLPSSMIDRSIRVLDMSGREMRVPFAIATNTALMDVSSLSTGSYMVTIRTARGMITQRFIKE